MCFYTPLGSGNLSLEFTIFRLLRNAGTCCVAIASGSLWRWPACWRKHGVEIYCKYSWRPPKLLSPVLNTSERYRSCGSDRDRLKIGQVLPSCKDWLFLGRHYTISLWLLKGIWTPEPETSIIIPPVLPEKTTYVLITSWRSRMSWRALRWYQQNHNFRKSFKYSYVCGGSSGKSSTRMREQEEVLKM